MLFALIALPLNGAPRGDFEGATVETTKLASNLYKLRIDVVNAVALIGPEGVFLSDSAYTDTGDLLTDKLRELGGGTIRYLLCTHYHHDHCGGAVTIGKTTTVIAHNSVRELLSADQVLEGEVYEAFPTDVRPHVTFSEKVILHINGERISVIHLPSGHTNGDTIVFFEKANVLHIGDLLFSDNFPAVDYEHGGSVEGLASSIRKVIDMAPPDVRIIAGHGRDYTLEELKGYRDMLISTVDVIRKEIEKGKSIEDMKKERVLDRWRKDWTKLRDTTDAWIETIYFSLLRSSTS
jgi:glyoxylase-like metal-dependent hydrolase (beta-lactamase superfamily II)